MAGMPLLVLAILFFVAAPAQAQTTVEVPSATGDQLVFFYDARTDRVPFLTVGNPGAAAVTVQIAFYPQNLGSRLGASVRSIAGLGNLVINPTEEAGGVANGQSGLAVVTPIVSDADTRPIVPEAPLMGGYTIANTAVGAGFGENPMGRRAVTSTGQSAAVGSMVDGQSVLYQRFAPNVLMIPTYYNPTTLDPPESDGNRVTLIAFNDQYGSEFDVTAHSVTTLVTVLGTDGDQVAFTSLQVNSVLLTDLQQIAGSATLSSSGKVFFEMDVGSGNVFGIFSQSLAAFGAGARMPAVAEGPGPIGPTPAPTPATTPTPTPAQTPGPGQPVCGNGIVEGLEDCDGDDLLGADCESEVGGASRCTGAVSCNADCTYNLLACSCNCGGDFDCEVEIDCEPIVEDCGEVFGVCENGSCVVDPVGTPEICNGFDPDPDFIDDPDPRCF